MKQRGGVRGDKVGSEGGSKGVTSLVGRSLKIKAMKLSTRTPQAIKIVGDDEERGEMRV